LSVGTLLNEVGKYDESVAVGFEVESIVGYTVGIELGKFVNKDVECAEGTTVVDEIVVKLVGFSVGT
jgi:hypothetical protein